MRPSEFTHIIVSYLAGPAQVSLVKIEGGMSIAGPLVLAWDVDTGAKLVDWNFERSKRKCL